MDSVLKATQRKTIWVWVFTICFNNSRSCENFFQKLVRSSDGKEPTGPWFQKLFPFTKQLNFLWKVPFPNEPRAVWVFDFTLKMLVFIEFDIVPGPDATPILEGQRTQVTSSFLQWCRVNHPQELFLEGHQKHLQLPCRSDSFELLGMYSAGLFLYCLPPLFPVYMILITFGDCRGRHSVLVVATLLWWVIRLGIPADLGLRLASQRTKP